MAKRKRLTPLSPLMQADKTDPSTSSAGTRPPIAQVSGEAAMASALEQVQGEMVAAQAEGRLIRKLDLRDIDDSYLIRDRMVLDSEELDSLQSSLSARGQQVPIEVVALPNGRYGLISGWRRCQALRGLNAQSEDARFAQVLALVRQPADRAEAYVAMVEENEIRAGLSFFERARIVARALETGVFDTEKAALQGLFSAASWSKRSKIKSFLSVVATLDGYLQFPASLSERLGLALAQVLTGPEADQKAKALQAELRAAPAPDPATERAQLQAWLQAGTAATTSARSKANPAETESDSGPDAEVGARVRLSTARAGRVVLEGSGVDADLIARLRLWLADQG